MHMEDIEMAKYISELIDIGMGNVIDMSVDDVILKDEIYQKDQTDSDKLYEKFVSMLTEEQKLNKIAARWPAKAVAQFFRFFKNRQ